VEDRGLGGRDFDCDVGRVPGRAVVQSQLKPFLCRTPFSLPEQGAAVTRPAQAHFRRHALPLTLLGDFADEHYLKAGRGPDERRTKSVRELSDFYPKCGRKGVKPN
jgi:hypothetical protein